MISVKTINFLFWSILRRGFWRPTDFYFLRVLGNARFRPLLLGSLEDERPRFFFFVIARARRMYRSCEIPVACSPFYSRWEGLRVSRWRLLPTKISSGFEAVPRGGDQVWPCVAPSNLPVYAGRPFVTCLLRWTRTKIFFY